MRRAAGCVAAAALMALAAVAAARESPRNVAPSTTHPPERIAIAPAGVSSSPAPLVGYVFAPAGGHARGAVVMLHGCGGAYDRKGEVNARHRMWGDYLASLGYEALLVDSFTSRGFREICTTPMKARTVKEEDRVGDAYAALAWLSAQPGIDAQHVALLGWSHGAGTTLAAIAQAHPPQRFEAAIAFYPGCTQRAARPERYRPYAPLLVLIGTADDWTPAAPCQSLADAVHARGEPMTIVTYPDTYHDFDNPALREKHVRHEVPNGVHPGAGVTTAPNPQAREDAKRRVAEFLAQLPK